MGNLELQTLASLFFFTWLALPSLLWIINLCLGRRLPVWVLMTGAITMGYLLLVFTADASDRALEAKMDSFDLDGDGGIGGGEMTPEAEKAMQDWASDTGRTMAIFTALPCSAVWCGLCFGCLYAGDWLVRKVTGHDKLPEPEAALTETDSENAGPYRPPAS